MRESDRDLNSIAKLWENVEAKRQNRMSDQSGSESVFERSYAPIGIAQISSGGLQQPNKQRGTESPQSYVSLYSSFVYRDSASVRPLPLER